MSVGMRAGNGAHSRTTQEGEISRVIAGKSNIGRNTAESRTSIQKFPTPEAFPVDLQSGEHLVSCLVGVTAEGLMYDDYVVI
jgi:hypothetical protein